MSVKVHLDRVGKVFATPVGVFRAVAPLELSIETGRFISLVGPSGCGKSTLFNIIAGLLPPTEGRIVIDGDDATGTIGRVGYMLQKDLLLPWRTVLDNVILGMEIQGKPLREARDGWIVVGTFILVVAKLCGTTSLRNTCQRLAPNE